MDIKIFSIITFLSDDKPYCFLSYDKNTNGIIAIEPIGIIHCYPAELLENVIEPEIEFHTMEEIDEYYWGLLCRMRKNNIKTKDLEKYLKECIKKRKEKKEIKKKRRYIND